MTRVQLVHLTRTFGSATAVDDLCLDIESGEMVALLGPSGCGKTTTLRMIAGLLEPTAGDVLFDGRSMLSVRTERRGAVMVFQKHLLFPTMTVAGNVGFGLRMQKVPKHEIERRAADMLELVRLPGTGSRKAHELSGGQQQRVALARALVVRPRVLLLDEPLANLDANLRIEMRELIRSIQAETGITSLFVTHDQEEAVMLADRVALMLAGVLQQFGQPADFYERPRTTDVARFFRNVNVLPGVRDGDTVATPAGQLVVDPRRVEGNDGSVLVTIRPEDIAIVNGDAPPGQHRRGGSAGQRLRRNSPSSRRVNRRARVAPRRPRRCPLQQGRRNQIAPRPGQDLAASGARNGDYVSDDEGASVQRSGIRRGLEATSTTNGHFAILALDHIATMAATMVPDNPEIVTRNQLIDAKAQITRHLRHAASAVLLDPMVGYSTVHTPADLADGIGLVLGLEASDYASHQAAPHLLEGWSVERAAEAGADAVKISFRFDPDHDARSVERFVADVAGESRRCQLPLFAEPLGVFHRADDRRRVTVQAASRFGDLGVDVLKLEFPVDVSVDADEEVWFEACAEVDAASPVPWTVLSGGESFERFHAMVAIASDAGASGFVAGRAVWRDCVAGGTVDTASAAQAARRLERLIDVVSGRARPWSQHPTWVATRDGGAS